MLNARSISRTKGGTGMISSNTVPNKAPVKIKSARFIRLLSIGGTAGDGAAVAVAVAAAMERDGLEGFWIYQLVSFAISERRDFRR